MPTPDQFKEYTDRLEEEAMEGDYAQYFDWQSISSICRAPLPHHPAYGLPFEEYAKRRSEFSQDDKESVRLSFRVPQMIGFFLPSLARRREAQTGGSMYRYLTLITEMGLIKFQRDYHDTYTDINNIADAMTSKFPSGSEKHEWMCMIFENDDISLGSSISTNKKHNPSVAPWLSAAIKQTCGDLKMTQSDMVLLCICIGVVAESTTLEIPKPVLKYFSDIILKFEFLLEHKKKQADGLKF